MRIGLMLKIFVLGVLIVVFGVALVVISGIVSERERYRARVLEEVAASTARSQTVTGPILILGYRDRIDGPGKQAVQVTRENLWVLPESLQVRSRITVEERQRGIYRVQVYRSTHRLTGVFHLPARFGLASDRQLVGEEPARLVVEVSDARGLRKAPVIRWQGRALAVEPGTHQLSMDQGFSARPGPLLSTEERRIPFEIELELLGTDRLGVVPVGASTEAEMESDWPHPSFQGGFLPDHREVRSDGFRASWRLSRFATGIDPADFGVESRRASHTAESGVGRDYAVRFVQPVDVYQQSQRAVKYGMLFVLLTFLAFFIYEVLRHVRVHPIQYGLVGAALALFFLLLVSLSEHIPFLLAYVIGSAACVGLLGFYVGHVLGRTARGLGFAALLAVLYAVLYVLLQSEDYALLLGTLLLFGVLAAVMVMTRRVDWNRIGEGSEAAPITK